MTEELLVQMFGQETWVSTEFYNNADQEMAKSLIKENVVRSAKYQKYHPVDEPMIYVNGYKKRVGEDYIDWFDNPNPDIIVFRTTVKVVQND